MHGINSFIILLAYFLSFISVLEGHLAEKHVFNGWGGGGGGGSTGAKWVGGWLGAAPIKVIGLGLGLDKLHNRLIVIFNRPVNLVEKGRRSCRVGVDLEPFLLSSAYISPPICSNRPILGKVTFSLLLFLDLQPIIHKSEFLCRHIFFLLYNFSSFQAFRSFKQPVSIIPESRTPRNSKTKPNGKPNERVFCTALCIPNPI